MGGNSCCAAVLQVLAPQLTALTATAHVSLQKEVQRAAQDAVRKVDRVLSLGSSSSKTTTVGVSSEDGRLAVCIEMLVQLIACVGASPVELTSAGSNHHDHTHEHSAGGCGGKSGGGCGGGHGHSHDHRHSHIGGSCGEHKSTTTPSPSSSVTIGDTSALRPHLDAMFQTLAAFVQPTVVTLEGNESSVAVNPFLAVKSAFTESTEPAASSSTSSDDVVMTESKTTVFAVPAAAVLAIVASISATRELLARYR